MYVAGRPGWATEIALETDGQVVLGVSTAPAEGRRWWASLGGGAWCRADGRPMQIRVSTRAGLAGGRYTFIPPLDAMPAGSQLHAGLDAAMTYVPPPRHGALLVAEGHAEVCVQTDGGPWDFAALRVIVEEAGGSFSDLASTPTIYGGGVRLYSNGLLHRQALESVRPPDDSRSYPA